MKRRDVCANQEAFVGRDWQSSNPFLDVILADHNFAQSWNCRFHRRVFVRAIGVFILQYHVRQYTPVSLHCVFEHHARTVRGVWLNCTLRMSLCCSAVFTGSVLVAVSSIVLAVAFLAYGGLLVSQLQSIKGKAKQKSTQDSVRKM